MAGAENRGAVTCYLDSLLFAMFARFDAFEKMLKREFEDEPRRKLATVLRLWVNLLRSGELIHTDTVSSATFARSSWLTSYLYRSLTYTVLDRTPAGDSCRVRLAGG